MIFVKTSFKIEGVQTYFSESVGFLVKPEDVANLSADQCHRLAQWSNAHYEEMFDISIFAHCGYRADPNLSNDVFETIVQSELASDFEKEMARLALEKRVTGSYWWETGLQQQTKRKRKKQRGFVYLLKGGAFCKIGVSTNVNKRIEQLGTLPPFDLELVCVIPTRDMYGLEEQLHEQFAEKRKRGEWFELSEHDIEMIKQISNEAKEDKF